MTPEELRKIAVAVCLRIQMRILLRQVEQEVKTRQLGRRPKIVDPAYDAKRNSGALRRTRACRVRAWSWTICRLGAPAAGTGSRTTGWSGCD